jgi:uncharacterized protein (DUF697 family)
MVVDKDQLATEVVKRYAMYAGGAGLIPIPFVDFAAIMGVEIKMLSELAKIYDVPFENDRVRPIVAAIVGGYASTKLGYGIGGSLIKAIPLVGPALSVLAVPGFGAGLSWAIGKVFIQHFASGGTFLDFDPESVREHFTTSHKKHSAA